MTRGKFYLITNSGCFNSFEFNGDMGPDGYGDPAFEMLHKVRNKKEFMEMIKEFNRENFQYKRDVWSYKHLRKHHHDFSTERDDTKPYEEHRDYFALYFSDWIFFKNISKSPAAFIDKKTKEMHTLLPGESIRFDFGRFHDKKLVPTSIVLMKQLEEEKTQEQA